LKLASALTGSAAKTAAHRWLVPPGSESAVPLSKGIKKINCPCYLVGNDSCYTSGVALLGETAPPADALQLSALLPPLRIEALGNPGFCTDLGIRYPIIGGSMAKGISSAAMVEALGLAGMLGFFGAAGLPLQQVESAIVTLKKRLGDLPFGFNLIHSPNEPDLEEALVDLYIRHQVRLIEASAFLSLTLPLVRFRVHGIHRDPAGNIVTPNRVIGKISREELAAKFLAPPPANFLQELVRRGDITHDQAELAAQIPVAQDITAEADSGGHTDNRPAFALYPTIAALRDSQQQLFPALPLRVGLAGGIGTPEAAAAAFALGADYIVTGSVNQACVESGTSDVVRQMLAETRQADVTMAPAADMFEMGVKVQVLKRGTMFSMRASKLYDLYRAYDSIDALPAEERQKIETTFFRTSLDEIWQQTRAYFLQRDRKQVERADRDCKYRLALVFRWYLGQAPHWANNGDASRKMDYQVWCGPAMGAFNEWCRGSFLEDPKQRNVATVNFNLLYGAALVLRLGALRRQGVVLPPVKVQPLNIAEIKEYLF